MCLFVHVCTCLYECELPTFLLSVMVRGLCGVDSAAAGVAATADGEVLSTLPAGIFTSVRRN